MPLALCHEDRRDNVTLFVPFLTRSTVGLRPRYAGVSEEVTEVMKVMSGRKKRIELVASHANALFFLALFTPHFLRQSGASKEHWHSE